MPFLEQLYISIGYWGVLLAMAIESACIPLPSEIILPMAGWMVSRGVFDLWWATIAGTLGCTVGSLVAYWVGAVGGRPFILRYGRYILVSPHDLEKADRWFEKYGDWAIFLSRLLPVVRTFISLPAGISKMNLPRFVVYTTVGSFPWSLGLVYAGKAFGDNWEEIRVFLSKFDYLIAAVVVALVFFYVYKHLRPSSATTD
ncbi:MAG: DedA family protein [Chloroflexi bacterium]|nr:DedA family protein [Chloroflexota bacterium]